MAAMLFPPNLPQMPLSPWERAGVRVSQTPKTSAQKKRGDLAASP
jgi:hypothetical protein